MKNKSGRKYLIKIFSGRLLI